MGRTRGKLGLMKSASRKIPDFFLAFFFHFFPASSSHTTALGQHIISAAGCEAFSCSPSVWELKA